MVSFRYHGNYVGPGWSAGRYQPSVASSKVRPVDEFDRTAKQHDMAYALKKNLKEADYTFYKQNIGRGLKRSIAALAVGAQGFLRKPKRSRFGFQKPDSFSKKEKAMAYPTPRKTPRKRKAPVKRRLFTGRKNAPAMRNRVKSYGRRQKAKRVLSGMRTRRRMRGAASSTSSGFFDAGSAAPTTLEQYASKGIVYTVEKGDVLADSIAPWSQSMTLGHSNYTVFTLRVQVALALTKLVANRLQQSLVKWADKMKPTTDGSFYFKLTYKDSTYGVIMTLNFDGRDKTWLELAKWFYDRIAGIGASTQFIDLNIGEYVGPLATQVPAVWRCSIDMTKCRISLYAKSSLKIQNRSVNTAGNDEAGDVDNVPLYGKSYGGTGNFAVLKNAQQYMFNIAPNVQDTDADFNGGGLTYKYPVITFKNTSPADGMVEPPVKTMFNHVRTVGKAHLDPGQVKTDNQVFTGSFNFNKLVTFYLNPSLAADNNLRIGKFRFFIFEKMIQAVATNATTTIRLAYELDAKYGCMATAPKTVNTTYYIDQKPQ